MDLAEHNRMDHQKKEKNSKFSVVKKSPGDEVTAFLLAHVFIIS